MSQKIPCAIFRWVEYELYNLEWHKEELRRLKEEILLKSPDKLSGGKSNVISDQTGQKAVKLVDHIGIVTLERKIKAIEYSLRNSMFKELYEWKYRQQCPWQEVCTKMNVSERTYFRIRSALIRDIARRLGEFRE